MNPVPSIVKGNKHSTSFMMVSTSTTPPRNTNSPNFTSTILPPPPSSCPSSTSTTTIYNNNNYNIYHNHENNPENNHNYVHNNNHNQHHKKERKRCRCWSCSRSCSRKCIRPVYMPLGCRGVSSRIMGYVDTCDDINNNYDDDDEYVGHEDRFCNNHNYVHNYTTMRDGVCRREEQLRRTICSPWECAFPPTPPQRCLLSPSPIFIRSPFHNNICKK